MSHDTIFAAAPVPPPLALPYPLILGRAGLAGFPSPAQDYEGRLLDLNEHLVKRPAATFFIKVTGDSMEGFGIHDGDLLVVDRSIEPRPGHILVAMLEGELTVKRYAIIDTHRFLCSANPGYPPIPWCHQNVQGWGL